MKKLICKLFGHNTYGISNQDETFVDIHCMRCNRYLETLVLKLF